MTRDTGELEAEVFARCRDALPGWSDLSIDDFDFDSPKGFSSVTLGVRAKPGADADPAAVLYRQLEGKENAILDFDVERAAFLLLGRAGIAATCLHYDRRYRLEEFYSGRTLTAGDVFDPVLRRKIADELFRLHHLDPDDIAGLPKRSFFELLHEKWGRMAREVLEVGRSEFPEDERVLCDELAEIHTDETRRKVMRCLPSRQPVLCHNDTYHGNIFLLDDGSARLLDFEFSCLNHPAFDLANLFSETIMEHGLPDPPHFRIGTPRFDLDDLTEMVGFYVANEAFADERDRVTAVDRMVEEVRLALLLSDYMYAMAAIPLALDPIQKIRFIPYAHQRFSRFLASWDLEFGAADR